jgi:hypothetical protein
MMMEYSTRPPHSALGAPSNLLAQGGFTACGCDVDSLMPTGTRTRSGQEGKRPAMGAGFPSARTKSNPRRPFVQCLWKVDACASHEARFLRNAILREEQTPRQHGGIVKRAALNRSHTPTSPSDR